MPFGFLCIFKSSFLIYFAIKSFLRLWLQILLILKSITVERESRSRSWRLWSTDTERSIRLLLADLSLSLWCWWSISLDHVEDGLVLDAVQVPVLERQIVPDFILLLELFNDQFTCCMDSQIIREIN